MFVAYLGVRLYVRAPHTIFGCIVSIIASLFVLTGKYSVAKRWKCWAVAQIDGAS